jgi:hypothetical protein
VHSLEGQPTLFDIGRDRIDRDVGSSHGGGNRSSVANIGGNHRDSVETDRSQIKSRLIWTPHGDAYCHALSREAVHQSPTEETPSAEHHNRAHYLLQRQARSI